MTSTQEVVSQAAAELQMEAPPRTWPFLGPICDSTVAATTECFSPFFPLVVQQRRSGASRARAARTTRARTPTRSTTGVDHATYTSADASSGLPGLSSAARSGPSSVRRTALTADNAATASATSEAGNCSLLLGNRQEQRKQCHRVIRLHPDSFELPRLPASATLQPRATSSTRRRGLAAQNVSSTLFADSHSARVDQDSDGPASYSQSSADASAAGAFTAVAQREALLAAFAAAAVADAASLRSKKGPGEGQRHRPHAGKAKKKLAGSRRTNSLSAAAADANTAGDGSSLAREKSKRCAAYQQQLMELQAAAAADDAALLQALEAEREHVRQRKLQEEQDRRRREEEEERRRQERKAREEAAAAAAAREEQLRRERQAAEEQRRRFEEEEAKKKKAQEEEEKRRREEEERRRLEQQLEEQRRRQAEEEERQRHQREQEERQRREKEEQQQQLRQAQEQPPPQREQEKQEDVGALQQQQQETDSGHGEAGTTVDTAAAISASNWLPAVEPGKPETTYMREVETLLAEERGMREVQLHQLPGISEDQVKALRISIKKQINTALNQLASTTSQVIRTCEGIRHFMRGLKGHPPAVSQFFVTQACERLLQLTEKGGQVSTRPSSVWAYAFLVRGMVQEDERVERAFRAHVYATCCYAAPFYYRKKQGMSVEQFRVARGQREGEDEEAFFSRMVACLRLWLSFLVASHKEEMAWSWLARFLNLNLATTKAVRRVCACALIEGLKIAGPALLKAYGRQFKKVMDLIQNALMPLLLAMQQKNEGTCISMYVTQLRTLLSDYYANNFTLPEPEGKSMKMEATEASPDV